MRGIIAVAFLLALAAAPAVNEVAAQEPHHPPPMCGPGTGWCIDWEGSCPWPTYGPDVYRGVYALGETDQGTAQAILDAISQFPQIVGVDCAGDVWDSFNGAVNYFPDFWPAPPIEKLFSAVKSFAKWLKPAQAVAQQAPPPVCVPDQGVYILAYPCAPPPDCGGFWDILLHPIQYMDCVDYRNDWEEYWYNFWLSLGIPWP